MVEMATFNVQRAKTPKIYYIELWFLCFALDLMVLNICGKFYENISNCFDVTERTRVCGRNGNFQCSKGNNSTSMQSKLRFLRSACRLMVLNICVKFHEIT